MTIWELARRKIGAWGVAGVFLLAVPGMSLGQPGKISANLSQALSNPSDPAAIFDYAQTAANAGDFRRAITALERLLILQPDLNNIRLELGVLYLRINQPALAQELIEQALADPSAPPDVQARGQELLTVARQGNAPSTFSGQASARLSYDSNANGNPEGVTPAPTSDLNASVWVGGSYRRDLGLQAGHKLVADGHFYASEYLDLSDEDTQRAQLGLGIDFVLDRMFAQPMRLTAKITAARTRKAGEDYRQDLGLSLAARRITSPNTSYQATVSVTDQDFRNSTTFSGNQANSGVLSRISVSRQSNLGMGRFSNIDVSYGIKNAATNSEAFSEISAGLTYGFEISPPVATAYGQPWIISLGAGLSSKDYEQTSLPTIYNFPQEDIKLSLNAGIEIPLSKQMGFLADITASKTNSNFDIGKIENIGVSIGIARRF